MFERKCKITFIAHGATIHSDENRISDKEKYPPLNGAGEEEMQNICDWLEKRGVKNDKIYTSPSLRAIQSADMVAKVYQDDFIILKDLLPRQYGVISGLSYDEIEEKYPDLAKKMYEKSEDFCPEGGESIEEFDARVKNLIKRIVEKNIGNRIIIVTHPDVIQAAVASAIGLPAKNQAKVYIKTGSATQISYFNTWSSLIYSGRVPL